MYESLDYTWDKNGNKLCVGDRYNLPNFYGSAPQKLTVEKIISSGGVCDMVWSVEEKTWSSSYQVVKAEKTETPEGRYIVCLEENGKFAPAVTPKEYTTRSRADKVAIEMAEKHDGVFYVLQVVGRTELKKSVKAEITNL